jgi:hypothetical protein
MARIIQVDGRKGNDTSNSGICIAHLRLKKDNNYKTVLGLPLWPTVAGKKRTHDLKTNRDK